MEDDVIDLVEAYLDGELRAFGQEWKELPFAHDAEIGRTVDYVSGRNRYIGYLISLGVYSFRGKKVGLDCANGASWNIARAVFDALGAETYVINAEPDGTNINMNAGSTHIDGLRKFVVENGLDAGFAYDGDADRCLCVDEKGIMYSVSSSVPPLTYFLLRSAFNSSVKRSSSGTAFPVWMNENMLKKLSYKISAIAKANQCSEKKVTVRNTFCAWFLLSIRHMTQNPAENATPFIT